MKRWLAVILVFCLWPSMALGMDGAYLSAGDLQALQPSYEAFLGELADMLVVKNLLLKEERENWILYQLGDFMQNGGFGSMLISYTPGLLENEDEAVTMQRFSVDTPAGTLTMQTLRRYDEVYSPLPGLPLETELLDAQGKAVSCRFRWIASGGTLLMWEGQTEGIVEVGATYISDGRPMYWYAPPVADAQETVTLEILSVDEDAMLATVVFVMRATQTYWTMEVM